MELERRYTLGDFPQGGASLSTIESGTPTKELHVVPIGIDALPPAVTLPTRALIELGDDPERPRDKPDARFRSRSEAVYRVACDLGRAGCSEQVIAGVLINPALGIARSVLEKK